MNTLAEPLACHSVAEVRERIVAIVRFGPPTATSGLRAGEFYQVTIDPGMFSQCGEYIRFGNYPGDEITGWQRAECIYLLSTLARVPYENKGPVRLEYFWSPALEASES